MAIGDFKTRLRAKFSRRHSLSTSPSSNEEETQPGAKPRAKSVRSLRTHVSHQHPSIFGGSTKLKEQKREVVDEKGAVLAGVEETSAVELKQHGNDLQLSTAQIPTSVKNNDQGVHETSHGQNPTSTTARLSIQTVHIEPGQESLHEPGGEAIVDQDGRVEIDEERAFPSTPIALAQNNELNRRQSLLPAQQTSLIRALLETEIPPPSRAGNFDYFTSNGPSTITANMVSKKIWVRRPNASATLVTIHEDDLVDDVREMILRKYANSLGKNFDAPDVTLRLIPRERGQEKILGPEEPMCRTLDSFYPGGQAVNEALVIDVPHKRTPRPSPRAGPSVSYVYADDVRPGESGSDYFPPMPVPAIPSPQLPNAIPVPTMNGASSNNHHSSVSTHAMSVLTTGHVPNLPSPGGSRRHYSRPRAIRQHTASPTVIQGHIQTPVAANNGTIIQIRGTRSRTHSSASEKSIAPPAPPLPNPPVTDVSKIQRSQTPPPRVSSPRPTNRTKKSKKSGDHPSLPAGLLNGAVPPINVLIVEDNIINLKLLEAFMKRLKVRWQTAMNGKEAVTKWRAGGFHLVLMDIQLPVMNGLEATREIRRLEKLNNIGVFSSSASSSAPEEQSDEPEGDDRLPSSVLFKSPVIIVALTASSLQSDRHEALAAGCNDFLTKVRFPIL